MATKMTDRDTDIAMACSIMSNGGIILYPTDTVWGIGCDATNPDAVARVYGLKHRADSKAMITLVGSTETLMEICPSAPDAAISLTSGIDNRPTTVVLNNICGLATNLLAPDGSAGIRVTRESFSKELCRRFGRPVVSTSANISGQPTAATFNDIQPEIIAGVDYICTTRRDDTAPAQPSVVAKVDTDGTVTILRK